jgi:arylsulfatase
MGYGDPGAFGGGAAIGAATPNMDRLAREGLKLTSTYSQPTCTPTRSAILTGRLPVRTGLTRPILAGDKITKNPWADEISLPRLLSGAGYTTVLSGKWHVGEAEGMRPHDVGFDEFYGYYPAQKELPQAFDKRRYPDLVLNPERMAMLRSEGGSEALVHGLKGGQTREVQKIASVADVAEGDRMTKEFTVKKIAELAANVDGSVAGLVDQQERIGMARPSPKNGKSALGDVKLLVDGKEVGSGKLPVLTAC